MAPILKFHILFDFTNDPYGGGNQFLKALRDVFNAAGKYADAASDASVFLYNSHHVPEKVWTMRQRHGKAVFIHRVDGPMSCYSREKDTRDRITYLMNVFADGTVFQSRYSLEANLAFGLKAQSPYALISNAPDPHIFYPGERPRRPGGKLSLVATSWSGNIKKGFDVYSWLDDNLDFSQFDMTFIGNSPVAFRNIKHVPPLPSRELAEELRKRDVYLTASVNDPCSNALLEAMHCGLVPVARRSGGHPEIVSDESLLFERAEEIPGILQRINGSRERVWPSLRLQAICDIADQYERFAEEVFHGERRELPAKKFDDTVQALKLLLGLRKKTFLEKVFG